MANVSDLVLMVQLAVSSLDPDLPVYVDVDGERRELAGIEVDGERILIGEWPRNSHFYRTALVIQLQPAETKTPGESPGAEPSSEQ